MSNKYLYIHPFLGLRIWIFEWNVFNFIDKTFEANFLKVLNFFNIWLKTIGNYSVGALKIYKKKIIKKGVYNYLTISSIVNTHWKRIVNYETGCTKSKTKTKTKIVNCFEMCKIVFINTYQYFNYICQPVTVFRYVF